MQKTIDLNADLGEHYSKGAGQIDRQLMPYLSSCNIACGGHSGDVVSMVASVKLAMLHKVNIGAHPSIPDRENFGRKLMPISKTVLGNSLYLQITHLQVIAEELGTQLTHIKPHGALYNLAADDLATAKLICETIARINPKFALLGLAQSEMAIASAKTGLDFWKEAFIDRSYENNARLTSRQISGAVLKQKESIAQLDMLIKNNEIISRDKKRLTIKADSICLHSDTPGALQIAEAIHHHLNEIGVDIRPIT